MSKDDVFERVTRDLGAAGLAAALGETIQTVWNWRARGFPPNKCQAIQRVTGVSVRDLRPDDWADYWPEPDHEPAKA